MASAAGRGSVLLVILVRHGEWKTLCQVGRPLVFGRVLQGRQECPPHWGYAVISKPRIVPLPVENSLVSTPRRWSMLT